MGWFILFVVIVVLIAIGKVASASGGKAVNARLRGYGIVVDGDQVKHAGRILGPLAGAHAEITDGTSRHTLTRVVTVAGALTKKTEAYVTVVTGNDGLQQTKVQGAAEVRRAQAWVAKFNALASVPAPQPAAGPAVTSYEAPDAGFNPDYLGPEERIARFKEERSIDRQPAPGRHRGAPEAPA
jgi:hypothetical protein